MYFAQIDKYLFNTHTHITSNQFKMQFDIINQLKIKRTLKVRVRFTIILRKKFVMNINYNFFYCIRQDQV